MPTETKPSLLGKALARCLGSNPGLTAAYMPANSPLHIVRSLVAEANRRRGSESTHPYALICSSDDIAGAINPNAAIKYRTGDRLVVVVGQHPDLSSFVQAFVEQLGPDYPHNASNSASLHALGRHALDVVLEEAGVQSPVVLDRDAAGDLLEKSLEVLKWVYQESQSGMAVWNTYWFTHVDAGLTALASHIRDAEAESLDSLLRSGIPASMSLPSSAVTANARTAGAQIDEAVSANWSTSDNLRHSARQISARRSGSDDLDWLTAEEWDHLPSHSAEVGFDHPFTALHTLGVASSHQSHIRAFSNLDLSDFANPDGSGEHQIRVHLLAAPNEPLDRVGAVRTPNIVAVSSSDMGGPRTNLLRIGLPLISTPAVVENVALAFSARSLRWVGSGEAPEVRDNYLWVSGWIQTVGKSRLVQSKIEPDPLPDSPMRTALARSTASLIALPTAEPAVMTMTERRTKDGVQSGKPTLWVAQDPDQEAVVGMPEKGGVLTVVFSEDGSTPTLDGQEMTTWSDPRLFYSHFNPGESHTIETSRQTFECTGIEDKNEFVSPIEAAIRKSIVVGTPPAASSLGARGWYEGLVSRSQAQEEWVASLGHVMVASDNPAREDLVLDEEHQSLVPRDLANRWKQSASSFLPEELWDSPEAHAFRSSQQALHLDKFLLRQSQDGDSWEWPSRTSWRELAGSPELDEYLSSYTDLVALAQEIGEPFGIFWASYPWSLSVWDVTGNFSCGAVLLSPLHPIRLAWLAGVEDILWRVPESRAVAMGGLVEGWNIPMHGPGSHTNESMMAVPIDSGEGGQFLGWSELVRVSSGQPSMVSPPSRIAGMDAPGAASSGLNGAAASSALRAYRRLNPHVTTLTVDLAAGADSPRLQEVDDALLQVVSEWVGEQDILPGGVRVTDSLHRRGPIPAEKVERKLLNGNTAPITWQRYDGDSPRSNIRLLQESGIKIAMRSSRGAEGGVLGAHPLRRLEAPTGRVRRRTYSSNPGLASSSTPLQKAIRAVESALGSAQLTAEVVNTSLISRKADWSVSGEGLLSPSALSDLINNATEGEQMLWEWQPPMLQQTRDTVVQRRPYISVVRIPGGFRQSLHSLVTQCSENGDVGDILSTLGVRGVGLSSLVAIGGTHATGALGFYLAFKLIETLQVHGSEVLVLPMDACDAFLRALTTDDGAELDSRRRADLLALVINPEGITLVPVEIKFQNAAGANAGAPIPLPAADSSDLLEARTQALESTRMLASLADRNSQFLRHPAGADSAERVLWNTAFASLLEAAFKLSSADALNPDVTLLLQRLLDEGMPLRVGRPLVTYFQLGSSDALIRTGTHQADPQQTPVGALVAESKTAFQHLVDPDSELVSRWRELFEWALTAEGPVEHEMPSPVPSSAPVLEPQPKQPARALDPIRASVAQPPQESAPEPTVPEQESGSWEATELPPAPAADPQPSGSGICFTVANRLDTVRQEPAIYWPGNTELTQMNMGVVGDLGTGKTQLLKALMLQLRRQAAAHQETPLSIMVFDYKRDFTDEAFLRSVGGKLLRPYDLPLNIFLRGERSPFERAQAFIDILSKIFNIGHVQRLKLTDSILEAYEAVSPLDPTLEEVYEIYREKLDGGADSVLSVLYNFVKGGVFTSDRSKMVSFAELMEDSVVVLNLSSLGTDQNSKNALVALFLNFYYEYMLSLPKWPFTSGENGVQLRRLNSYLLIDEASNIMKYDFDMLDQLLTQGREFGVGVVLSSQYLEHFKTKGYNYGTPLRSWFIHRVPHVTPNELRTLGLVESTDDTARRIQSQEVFGCYYRSLGVSGAFVRTIPHFELAEEPYE